MNSCSYGIDYNASPDVAACRIHFRSTLRINSTSGSMPGNQPRRCRRLPCRILGWINATTWAGVGQPGSGTSCAIAPMPSSCRKDVTPFQRDSAGSTSPRNLMAGIPSARINCGCCKATDVSNTVRHPNRNAASLCPGTDPVAEAPSIRPMSALVRKHCSMLRPHASRSAVRLRQVGLLSSSRPCAS